MSAITYVGIAEYRILDRPGQLALSALGSCVAVCLWDCETKLAGLLHALLSSPSEATDKTNPAKFVDVGIEKLVSVMESRGAVRKRLRAKLVGGACLYYYENRCAASEIGRRNVAAARKTLRALGIPIVAEHVGGEYGRSIRFRQEDFEVRVRVLAHEEVVM